MSDARRAARLMVLRLSARPLVTLGALTRRCGRVASVGRPPRILLIRPDHVGDVLLATPAARVLLDALPEAQIDWLVGPWSADMARRAGGPGDLLTVDFPAFTRRPERSPVEPYRVLLREAARLRAREYDAALILRPDHWWGALLATVAGIPRRFGFSVAECRLFLTDTLPPPSGHVVPANQSLAQLAALRLGASTLPEQRIVAPRFPVSDEEIAWAEAWEERRPRPPAPTPARSGRDGGGDRRGGPLVALHPGSGAALKNWLPGRWAAVARSLGETYGAQFVLTGGPGECALIEEIADRLDPRPRTLIGKTTLGQLAALFARCDLVIGCDSGPLHLAAAVGTPTVRLYGPTDVREFGPWPPVASHVALAAGLPCQPCRDLVAPPCGATETPACLRAVRPDTVVEAAGLLMERAAAAGTASRAATSIAADAPC